MLRRLTYSLIGLVGFLAALKFVGPTGAELRTTTGLPLIHATAAAPQLWRMQRVILPQGTPRCVLSSVQNGRQFALLYDTSMDNVVLWVSRQGWSIPGGYMVRMTFMLDGVQSWGIVGARSSDGMAGTASLPAEQIRFMLGNLSLARTMEVDIPDGNAVREPSVSAVPAGVAPLHNAIAPERLVFSMENSAGALDEWVNCAKELPDSGHDAVAWLDSHRALRAALPQDGSFGRWRSYAGQDPEGRRVCGAVAEAQRRAAQVVIQADRKVVLHLVASDWPSFFEDGTSFEVFFALGDETPRVYRAQRNGPYVSVFLDAGDTSAGRAPAIGADDFLRRFKQTRNFTVGFSAALQLSPWHVSAQQSEDAAEGMRYCLTTGVQR